MPRLHLPPPLLLRFVLLFLAPAAASASCCDVDVDGPASRVFFPMDGDVAWIVQVSDLHLSAFHHDRARDLEDLLAPALRVVRPALLLVTGDITDAKNKDRTSTRQDESEWVQYRNSMDTVVKKSGIDKRRIFDIRGNHDKYGVPCVGHKLDFFSVYSISAQLNRTSTIQSISLVGNKWKFMFVGMDDTMRMGFRGPSNLFGHPTDKRIDTLDLELKDWGADPAALTTKIAFGHFPMSFTASSETGQRYESVFARRSVSAYLCGHLHATFGKQLWRQHTITESLGYEQKFRKHKFWEWEVGDWKESRLMRILAIDQGDVSFLDITLDKHGFETDFPTTILITYPIDSRSMSQVRPDDWVSRNDINALVFSVHPVHNVTAKVYDSSKAFEVVEEIPLQISPNSLSSETLFSAKWNAPNYKGACATRYWLQIFVLDVHGKETASKLRPFSVEGKSGYLHTTWLAYMAFYLQWEKIYPALLWSNISFLIILLLLPKLVSHFMGNNASYRRWTSPVSASTVIYQEKLFHWPLQFLIGGSSDKKVWCGMFLYLACLLCLPWFWGNVTSVNGQLATMSIVGWMMNSADCQVRRETLGIPDVMTITLPFMYMVVTPLFLLVYCLFAERSAFIFHSGVEAGCSRGTCSRQEVEQEQNRLLTEAPLLKPIKGEMESSSLRRRSTRTAILLACWIVIFAHIKYVLTIGRAYGVRQVALSPVLSLVPPFFLVATVYLSH